MNKSLALQAAIKLILGLAIVGALLFITAGSLAYWNAWLLLVILGIPSLVVGIYLFKNDPSLLQKRLEQKESESAQKIVIVLSGFMFIGGFVVAALNYRYSWHVLPLAAVIAAALVFLMGYAIFALVLRENSFLSRSVEIQAEQRLIDSGLYGLVRHPMYVATLLMFLSMPLVLGSAYAFLIFLIYLPLLVLRIANEEKVLAHGLPGYADYQKRVKYRLIPYIW